MKIHFVCTGNVYRSRMAEAYLNSKQLPEIQATSSGIVADMSYDYDGPISWSAMRIIFKYALTPFMSMLPTQTTLEILNNANLIIFMKSNHHTFSQNELGWVGTNYEVWEIADMDSSSGFENIEDYVRPEVIPLSEQTFDLIREKVDDLVKRLQNPSTSVKE